ncbi:MAG: glycosyltransferase family 9 protein [Blastocatellia bacterium]
MRVLIVKLSSIGDVVHTLPAAAVLRRALPEAWITWVVERRASAILQDSPVIDELIELDTRAWRNNLLSPSTIADLRASLNQLRESSGNNGAGQADLAIDFQGLIKSGVLAFASRATRRLGFGTPDLREKASKLFLTEQIETSQIKHVIDKNLELAFAAIHEQRPQSPTSAGPLEFPIQVSSEDEAYIDAVIGNNHRNFAILNPGGGWSTKLWSAERFAELGDWLQEAYGFTSFVTYGPGELPLAERVAARSRSSLVRPLGTTLKQFIALARRAALFVGGDTGPLHLAAACRTPIVGLYGPTSPERNGPFDPRDITVGRELWCRADCHRRSCWHWECMDIKVSDVKSAIVKRLAS